MTYRNLIRFARFAAAATVVVGLLIPVAVNAADPPALGKPTIAYAAPSMGKRADDYRGRKILLEKVGYKVEVKLLDTGVIYSPRRARWMSSRSHGFRDSKANQFGDSLEIL
jgi:hypothetical protein